MPRGKQGAGLGQIQVIIERERMRVLRQLLEEELARVLDQAASIKKRIEGLDGRGRAPRAAAKRGPKPGSGRRPAGGGLRDYVVKAFEGGDVPLTTAELAEKVVKVGFKTKAKPTNLRVMLVKVLANKQQFKKVKRGVYKLRK